MSRLQEVIEEVRATGDILDFVFVVNRSGFIQAIAPVSLFPAVNGTSYSSAGFLTAPLAANKTSISGDFQDFVPSVFTAVATPIAIGGGPPNFALVGVIDAEGWESHLSRVNLPHQTWIEVTDQKGTLIRGRSPAAAAQMTNVSGLTYIAGAMREGEAVLDDARASDGSSTLAAAVKLPGSGWVVAAVTPSELAGAARVNLVSAVLLLTAAGSITAAVAALVLARSLTTRIVELSSAAKRIEKGGPVVVAPAGPREVRELAKSLGSMASSLTARAEENRRMLEELKASKEARESADARSMRLQDLVIRVIGHDLKAPIGVIQGYHELIALKLAPALSDEDLDRIRGNLRKANEAAASMLVTLSNARAISRLTMDAASAPKPEAFDLPAMVRQTVSMFRPLAEAKGLTVEVAAPPQLLVALPPGFESVVGNLVSNAIKFSPPGGTVRVTLEERDTKVRLEVMDNGPGIPPDEQAKLFRKFERLSRETSIGSHGLGLSIVASLVELAGGTISLQDRPDDKSGTVFLVELPRTSPAESERAGRAG